MSLLEAVERWLPPPSVLRMDGLGVDISESSIKYIGFAPGYRSGTTLHLTNWGEVPIPADVLSRGEIKNVAALSDAIKTVREKTGRQYMRLSLPEERVYLFETEVDGDMGDKELRNLLEFRLEENVPLSPRDSYFDYHVFQNESSSTGCSAAVTVSPRATIDSYYEACLRAGVTALSFEVEPQAMARAVVPPNDKSTRLLVDFGKTRTGIGIVYRGILLYTSTIDLGGNELSNALRRSLGEKSEDEFTTIKNEQGLVRGAKDSTAAEALLSTVSAIKDEVLLRIQYWNDKEGSSKRPIEQIIICGGSANLRGLPAYLSETLGIETVLADVWQNAFDTKETTPPIDRRHSYGHATAVGLGLTSFIENI